MAVSVTMLQTRRGEDGNLWTTGSIYSASDAFAQLLVSSNMAAGVLPKPDQTGLTEADKVAIKGVVSKAWKSRSLKKSLIGRMKTQALAADHTTHLQWELEAPFYAIRIGVPNIHTATIPNVKVAVGPQTTAFAATSAGTLNTSGGWINATFAGAASVTLPARVAAERPSWTWTDWILCPSVARADGGTRPLLVARVEVPTASGQITIPFQTLSGWTDGITDLGRLARRKVQAVLGVTTTGSFNSTTDETTAFIPLAVEYALAGVVGRQFLLSGDSTVEGVGVGSFLGHAQRAILESSSLAAPSDYFNAALHAQTAAVYTEYLNDVVAAVQPDVVVFSPYTVNSYVSTIATGTLQQWRGCAGRVLAMADQYDASVILLTGLPTNDTFKTINNDSVRRDLNAEFKGVSALAALTADISTTASGIVNGSDQMQFVVGFTADGVHPNDAGYQALKAPVAAAMTLLH